MRSKFDRELAALKDDLIEMGSLNEKSLAKIIEIFEKQQSASDMERIKAEVKEYERQVDELEHSVQTRAIRLLYSQQPVARDLRLISTALNIITDMERISDQAYDIAEISMYFKNAELVKQPENIMIMVDKCIKMVNKSVDSFIAQDINLANEVINSDDEVDDLFMAVRTELVELVNSAKENADQAIDFMIIAKYLERIADHAVNISEWVIFNLTGEHKNHLLI